MNKKALIADPDLDEARKQAAILQDDGYDVKTLGAGQLFDALSLWQPDVLVLRHERTGQSGLAVLTRIKKQKRFAGIGVVLTTSELMNEALHDHSVGPSAADAYVRLPVGRRELLQAAHSIPDVVDAIDADIDVPGPSDGRPPPLPPSRVPIHRFEQMAKSNNAVLTPKDVAYVENVFSAIQAVDPGIEHPQQGAVPQSGPERKLAILRQKLREYEFKLGRLKVLWHTREAELNEREDALEHERIEIDGLRLRIEELQAEVKQGEDEMARRESAHGRLLSEHYDDAALREAEALQHVAAQQYQVQKLETKLRRLGEDKDAQQRDLTEKILEWDRAYKTMQTHHYAVVDASHDEVLRLEGQLRDREDRLRRLRRDRDEQASNAALWKEREHERSIALYQSAAARAASEDALLRQASIAHQPERRARIAAQDEGQRLSLQVCELQERVFRAHRLLANHDRALRRDIMMAANAERDQTRAHEDARRAFGEERKKRLALQQVLSLERAFGEAALHKEHAELTHLQVVHQAQMTYFGAQTAQLTHDAAEQFRQREETDERLRDEEANHTEQRARAEAAEAELAEYARATSVRIGELQTALASKTEDYERTGNEFQKLRQVHAVLDDQHDELRSTHDELKAHSALENEHSLAELKARQQRIGEVERDLDGLREDLRAKEATIGARDERIFEMQSRQRESDADTIRLEGVRDRLEMDLAEAHASVTAQQEREGLLVQQLAQRDTVIEEGLAQLAAASQHSAELGTRIEALVDEVRKLREKEQRAAAAKEAQQEELLAAQNAQEQNAYENAELRQALDTARAEVLVGGS